VTCHASIWHTGGKGEHHMSTITFDTLEFTRKLRDAGFDEKQAEAVVRVIADAQGALVTREHFDAKIEILRVENSHTRWMLGAVLALAAANFAKQFF
jgi:hypothetical protein